MVRMGESASPSTKVQEHFKQILEGHEVRALLMSEKAIQSRQAAAPEEGMRNTRRNYGENMK
jgi:hypothetical protein